MWKMNIAELNLRGRMAYGIDCLVTFIKESHQDIQLYKDEIEIFSQYTSTRNFADWDERIKALLFKKYPEDEYEDILPGFFEDLYWIGAGELYGQPSDCKESEDLLYHLMEVLSAHGIALPDIAVYSSHQLDAPVSTDDYFGEAFLYDCVL